MTVDDAGKAGKAEPRPGGWNMGGYSLAMRKYSQFSGRSSRAEFWHFFVASSILIGFFGLPALLVSSILAFLLKIDWFSLLMIGFAICHIPPALAVAVRRMHDVENSGWCWLLVPSALVLIFMKGTSGPNKYGPEPDPIPAWEGHPTVLEKPVELSHAMAPTAVEPKPTDIITQIERLAALRAAGGLSEAEFEVMKAEALNRSRR
jgi:uncharacterized membrane protein YhaH (DUF805 family)